LCGIGLRGVGADNELGVDDAPRLIRENSPVSLSAFTTRLGMVDDRVIIGELLTIPQIEPVEGALTTLAAKKWLAALPTNLLERCLAVPYRREHVIDHVTSGRNTHANLRLDCIRQGEGRQGVAARAT
jgi:hypothetical protein